MTDALLVLADGSEYEGDAIGAEIVEGFGNTEAQNVVGTRAEAGAGAVVGVAGRVHQHG